MKYTTIDHVLRMRALDDSETDAVSWPFLIAIASAGKPQTLRRYTEYADACVRQERRAKSTGDAT